MADFEVVTEIIDVQFPAPAVVDIVMVEGPRGQEGPPGPPGTTEWGGITDKPAVIAAGATQADARTAIGAGTSSLTLGSTNSTAKPGDYTPIYAEVVAALGFTPSPVGHSHTESDITGLATTLAGKSNVGHSHAESDITGLVSSLAGKAASTHSHTESDITGLTSDLAGKEPTITAGTTAQYWRGDKSWQTPDKTAVGLGNVDNTSDANKPVSSATTTALALKANLAGTTTFTGTVSATNPRWTSPLIANGLFDADGNPLIVINKATGGVNYFTLGNAAAGAALTFAATGSDTDIGVNISSKGSAAVQINSRNAVTRVSVPASASAAGVADTVAWDSSYFYTCIATNTWVRTALATW